MPTGNIDPIVIQLTERRREIGMQLDYLALAAADLIEQQAAELAELRARRADHQARLAPGETT